MGSVTLAVVLVAIGLLIPGMMLWFLWRSNRIVHRAQARRNRRGTIGLPPIGGQQPPPKPQPQAANNNQATDNSQAPNNDQAVNDGQAANDGEQANGRASEHPNNGDAA